MDIDIAVALVVVAYNQQRCITVPFSHGHQECLYLFETDVHVGLYTYVAAITLNMICSETMMNLKKTAIINCAPDAIVSPAGRPGLWKFIVPLLWLSSAVVMGFCWFTPYL